MEIGDSCFYDCVSLIHHTPQKLIPPPEDRGIVISLHMAEPT